MIYNSGKIIGPALPEESLPNLQEARHPSSRTLLWGAWADGQLLLKSYTVMLHLFERSLKGVSPGIE